MKTSNYTSVLKKAGVIITLICLIATTMAAQKRNDGKIKLNQWAVKNLVQGVSHENDGVRKASIYYVGLFRVDKAVDALVEQLKNEKYPAYRQMIVLSLYMIGNNKALEAINKTAETDPDQEVVQTCLSIKSIVDKDKTFFALMNGSK